MTADDFAYFTSDFITGIELVKQNYLHVYL